MADDTCLHVWVAVVKGTDAHSLTSQEHRMMQHDSEGSDIGDVDTITYLLS
jgi:hypothetical protein